MFKTPFALLSLVSIVSCQMLTELEWNPQYFSMVPDLCKNPPLLSYHLHPMMWANVPKQVEKALTFQREFMEHFGIVGRKNCTFNVHDPNQKEICAWGVHWVPDGPFNNAQYAFFIPKADYQRVVEWSSKHRNGLDILIHPNTGCQIQDHSLWAEWNGSPWQLDAGEFTCNAPWPACGGL